MQARRGDDWWLALGTEVVPKSDSPGELCRVNLVYGGGGSRTHVRSRFHSPRYVAFRLNPPAGVVPFGDRQSTLFIFARPAVAQPRVCCKPGLHPYKFGHAYTNA